MRLSNRPLVDKEDLSGELQQEEKTKLNHWRAFHLYFCYNLESGTKLNLCECNYSKKRWGFPGGSDDKESVCSAKDLGSIPGLGQFPGEGNGNPPLYSCLENSMDRILAGHSSLGCRVRQDLIPFILQIPVKFENLWKVGV